MVSGNSTHAPLCVRVITLIPDIWPILLSSASGLVGKAFETGSAMLEVVDLRDFGEGRHRQVDDAPFGGGPGMVLQVGPIHRAITHARRLGPGPVLLLSPRGKRFDQQEARLLLSKPGFTLVCGRYEGVDERAREYIDGELSIGDHVLSAGDPAAWCVIDAVVRLVPGVLGNAESASDESFARGQLEYPQYTRPAVYDGHPVPEVLRSGDHGAIESWRREQALAVTQGRRPDLLRPHNQDEAP